MLMVTFYTFTRKDIGVIRYQERTDVAFRLRFAIKACFQAGNSGFSRPLLIEKTNFQKLRNEDVVLKEVCFRQEKLQKIFQKHKTKEKRLITIAYRNETHTLDVNIRHRIRLTHLIRRKSLDITDIFGYLGRHET